MSERPRFYPNANSLEDRAQKLERVKGLVETIYQNLGGDQGPTGLNIINPQTLPEGPMERVAEIVRRGTKVAQVRQYGENKKIPDINSQIAQTTAEIKRIEDLIHLGVPTLRGLSAFLRPEEIAVIEAQLSLVTPDVTLTDAPSVPEAAPSVPPASVRPETPVVDKEKKGIRPIATSKMQALENIVSNNEETSLEGVIKLFGKGLEEEGKTPKKRLAWNMVFFGLNRSVMMLSRRIKNQSATEGERALWNNLKTTLNVEADQDVIKTFTEHARKWFDNKRGVIPSGKPETSADQPSVPKTDEAQESEDYSGIKNHPEMATFLYRLPQPTRVLIEKFLDSKQGGLIMEQIKRFRPKDELDGGNFMQRLAGAIFEQVGYHHLVNEYANRTDLIVLSPEEVFVWYQKIYPDREVANFAGHNLTFGISGTTYPDGLVLRKTNEVLFIDAVVDYKLWVRQIPVNATIERQLQNYRYPQFVRDFFRPNSLDQSFHTDILHQLRPEIPVKPLNVNTNLEIMYGVPENCTIQFPDEIVIEKIPMNSTIFNQFNSLLGKIVRENGLPAVKIEEEEVVEPVQIPQEIRFPDGQDTHGMSETELKILEGLLIALENPLEEKELALFVFPDQDEKTAISKLRFAMPSFRAKSMTRKWTVETTPQTAEDKRTFLTLTKIPEEENNGSRAQPA